MKTFVTIADVPVGYTTPPFPSLYWPLGDEKYSISYLYYTPDIWRFTVFWTMILFGAFYGVAGLWAAFIHRGNLGALKIFLMYFILGALQAFVSSSLVGLLLAAIYNAGLFSMSTWIPLCSGVVQVLFNVVTSYSLISVVF